MGERARGRSMRQPGGYRAVLRATMPGYALYTLWFEGTKSFDVAGLASDPASMFAFCVMATDMAALVAAACLYRRVVTLAGRRGVLRAAVLLAAVSAAGLLALDAGLGVPLWLAGALGACLGLARSALTLAWMEVFCRFGMREACVGFACSTLAGLAAAMLLDALAAPVAGTLACAAAGAACALLVPGAADGEGAAGRGAGVREEGADGAAGVPGDAGGDGTPGGAAGTPGGAAGTPGADAEDVPGRWSFPLQPTLLSGVFATASLLVLALAPEGCADVTPKGTASALAALCLLAMALLWFDRLDIRLLGNAAVPLACFGLLGALSTFGHQGLPAVFAARLGYQLFSTFMFVLLFNISYRYGVSPLWLFGFSRAPRIAAAIVVPLVTGSGALAAPSAAADAVLAGTLVVLVAATSLYTVGESFTTTWGIRPLPGSGRGRGARGARLGRAAGRARGAGPAGDGGLPEAGGRPAGIPAMSVEGRCRRAAFLFGLTRREEEVLVLLVRGMSTPDIERELTISNGTARNHVQHVYKKLDVHSRDELRALVGSGRFDERW